MPEKKKKNELLKMYDRSSPYMKKAWRQIVKAQQEIGWKDFYYMVLALQEEAPNDTGYKLRRNPAAH